MKFQDDHFYKQFDRYPEGRERFEACARHATLLLNSNEERKARELAALTVIRDALAGGVGPAKVALAIQERIMSEFDTDAECPTIADIAT